MRRTQTKNTVRPEEARPQRRVLLVKTHRRLTFIAVFTVHTKKSLLSTYQRSMQTNRNINLWEEKAPIYRLSRSKAPKTQQSCYYRHTRKTGELILLFNTGVDFSLRNNFAKAGSFAKVSIPVYIYNSLLVNSLNCILFRSICWKLKLPIRSYKADCKHVNV